MNKVVLIYSKDFKKLDFGSGHPMRGDRYEKALKEFKIIGLLDNLTIKEPEPVSRDIISLFHTSNYIDKVEQVSKTGQGSFGEEVPGIKGIYGIISLSVSASVTAANYIIGNGSFEIAVNICGGWHHAFENKGRGFCIFNDIGIVVNYLLTKRNINKIMVIDYDAHHGDGTQRAFYDRDDVYTVSFHQNPETLYPFNTGFDNETGTGKGSGFNRNFPLSVHCEDKEFIPKFSLITEIVLGFRPELIIVQMGVDGSKDCLISNMQLTKKSYEYASKIIIKLQKRLNFKLLVLGGGGFVHPMLGQNWGVQIKNFIEK